MNSHTGNPFVLPGFGQSGELGQNPLLASMEMMRQAWDGLAGQGGFGVSAMTPTLSDDELARRISDLRVVENWLRMNLTVLSSTIQGLEVQRATINTLKSFAASASAGGAVPSQGSPLDAVLGAHAPAAQAKPETAGDTSSASASAFDAAAASEATQAWWGLLQDQFNTLAAATTATMQGVAASAGSTDGAGSTQSGVRGKEQGKGAASAASARKTAKTAKTVKTARTAGAGKAVKSARPAARKTTK